MPLPWSQLYQVIGSTIAALGLVWGATQWAAAKLAYQAALGTPWVEIAGLAIYAPWKLFGWWVAFDAQAPDVFARAGLRRRVRRGHAGVVALTGAARRAEPDRSSRPMARPAGRTTPTSRTPVCSPIAASCSASMMPTISGTTAPSMCSPSPRRVPARASVWSCRRLLTWPHSAVIHDIKGENWELTAGWRATLLDLPAVRSDRAQRRPASIHCWKCARGAHEVRDVQNIADILVDPDGTRERRDHWEKTAHALLTGAILHVLYAEEEKTLARVATFLADPAALDRAHACGSC